MFELYSRFDIGPIPLNKYSDANILIVVLTLPSKFALNVLSNIILKGISSIQSGSLDNLGSIGMDLVNFLTRSRISSSFKADGFFGSQPSGPGIVALDISTHPLCSTGLTVYGGFS